MSELPPTQPNVSPADPKPSRAVSPYVGLCLAVGIGTILFRILVLGEKEQTSLMFIGLPTALAMITASLPRASSALGVITKGITLFLLILGILMIEGFICILVASPLFYGIGLIIGLWLDWAKKRKKSNKQLHVFFLPMLAVMSLEGFSGILSFPRDEVITVSKDIKLTPSEARSVLAKGPQFNLGELPPFLKLGFPAPHQIQGNGLDLGNTWHIHFAGGEGKPGDLNAKVIESNDRHIRVVCTQDTSHISHWLDWKEAIWTIEPTAHGTRVTLAMSYKRLLDPSWYFKPLEQYGVRIAGQYFLDQTFKHP